MYQCGISVQLDVPVVDLLVGLESLTWVDDRMQEGLDEFFNVRRFHGEGWCALVFAVMMVAIC